MLGDGGLKDKYLELMARNVALERVIEFLKTNQQPAIDPEFYRYQETLIKGEINNVQSKINQLKEEHPHLDEFYNEQFRDQLLAIEADTYAEFVRSGRLNKELAPMLQDVLQGEN